MTLAWTYGTKKKAAYWLLVRRPFNCDQSTHQSEKSEANTKGDGGNVPRRLVGKTESWRALVDNRQGANGTGDQEEEWRSPNSPWDWVLADVHSKLDQEEDDRSEAGGTERSEEQPGENGT